MPINEITLDKHFDINKILKPNEINFVEAMTFVYISIIDIDANKINFILHLKRQ